MKNKKVMLEKGSLPKTCDVETYLRYAAKSMMKTMQVQAWTRYEKPFSPSPRFFGERGAGGEGRYLSIANGIEAFPALIAPHPQPFSPDDRGEGGKSSYVCVAEHHKFRKLGLSDKVLAAEYRLALPDGKLLVAEVERTQVALDQRTLILSAKNTTRKVKKTKRKGGGK